MKEYRLVITFKYNIWQVQEEIENILGYSDGSGFGFGERDLDYNFNNIRSLHAAVRKVRRLPRRIKCKAWETIPGSEDYYCKEVSLRGIK